jgi:hypothetical protein
MSSSGSFVLPAESELRIDLSSNSTVPSQSLDLSSSLVSVTVVSGTAEIFGSELPCGVKVPLPAGE